MQNAEPDTKRPRLCSGDSVPISTIAAPLDQGTQKTCVPHAFATAAAQGLLAKHGIVVDPEKLAEKFEERVESWQGMPIVDFCEKWNATRSSIWIKNCDNRERYKLRLDASDPINDIVVAYEKLEKARGVLNLVCAVKHGRVKSHAVTADMPYRAKPKMRAINSWGAVDAVIDVTPTSFQCALLIEPVVEAWARDGGAEKSTAYRCTTAYMEMKQDDAAAPGTVAAMAVGENEEDPRSVARWRHGCKCGWRKCGCKYGWRHTPDLTWGGSGSG